MSFAILFGLAFAAAAFAASSSAKAGKNYRLISAEERARKNPQTFRIPTLVKRRALKSQQFAKLLFAVPAGPGQPARSAHASCRQLINPSRDPQVYNGAG